MWLTLAAGVVGTLSHTLWYGMQPHWTGKGCHGRAYCTRSSWHVGWPWCSFTCKEAYYLSIHIETSCAMGTTTAVCRRRCRERPRLLWQSAEGQRSALSQQKVAGRAYLLGQAGSRGQASVPCLPTIRHAVPSGAARASN